MYLPLPAEAPRRTSPPVLSIDSLIAGLSSAFADLQETQTHLDTPDVYFTDDHHFSSTSSSSSSSSSSASSTEDEEPAVELEQTNKSNPTTSPQTNHEVLPPTGSRSMAMAVPQPLQRGSTEGGESKGWVRSDSAKRALGLSGSTNPIRDPSQSTSPRAWSAGKLSRVCPSLSCLHCLVAFV